IEMRSARPTAGPELDRVETPCDDLIEAGSPVEMRQAVGHEPELHDCAPSRTEAPVRSASCIASSTSAARAPSSNKLRTGEPVAMALRKSATANPNASAYPTVTPSCGTGRYSFTYGEREPLLTRWKCAASPGRLVAMSYPFERSLSNRTVP